ncbi:hypothetical protein [Streptomyces sp. BA2]|uniref:hypothetical protein n=1 Tax=Streptomyces sp. BA2 TaxID=436595 RepID=UPI003FA7EC52
MTKHKAVPVDIDVVIEDLRTLVNVESPSRDLETSGASAKVVAAVIESRLGSLVQAIHGLAALDDRAGGEILVTADEEVGSRSSCALIEERACLRRRPALRVRR